ncbi:MAG: hypothetical protein SOS98_07025 [Varibaculum sp.]|nr:hypothetical protein [Varibaculum sp.]
MNEKLLTIRPPGPADAVGLGLAWRAILREQLSGAVDEAYWESFTEEDSIEFWHKRLADRGGRRIAVATQSHRIVGLALLEPAPGDDHGYGQPARNVELRAIGVLSGLTIDTALSRLYDYVLPDPVPAQCWVYRINMSLRRFLRTRGFGLDGLSAIDEATGLEISRMVR